VERKEEKRKTNEKGDVEEKFFFRGRQTGGNEMKRRERGMERKKRGDRHVIREEGKGREGTV